MKKSTKLEAAKRLTAAEGHTADYLKAAADRIIKQLKHESEGKFSQVTEGEFAGGSVMFTFTGEAVLDRLITGNLVSIYGSYQREAKSEFRLCISPIGKNLKFELIDVNYL